MNLNLALFSCGPVRCAKNPYVNGRLFPELATSWADLNRDFPAELCREYRADRGSELVFFD